MLPKTYLVLFAAVCLSAPSLAAPDASQCVRDYKIKAEDRIAACSAVIEAGQGDIVEALLVRGSAYGALRDYDRSFADFNRALELKPDSVPALLAQGAAFYNKAERDAAGGHLDPADYGRAMADYDKAVGLEPQNPEALTMRGELYGNRYYPAHDDAKSLADFAAALRAKPDFGRAHLSRGGLCMLTGDFECVLADWSYDPVLAKLMMDDCHKRNMTDAERQAVLDACNKKLALRLTGILGAYYFDGRGFVYLRLARYDEAITDYDVALSINPKISSSLYGRGIAKLRQGNAEGAADIAAAKALKPEIAEIFAGYGVTP